MKGKMCIVTGSNCGIDKETTLALAKMGATVVMVVCSNATNEEILKKSGNGFIEIQIPKIIAEASEGGSEVFKVKYFDTDAYQAVPEGDNGRSEGHAKGKRPFVQGERRDRRGRREGSARLPRTSSTGSRRNFLLVPFNGLSEFCYISFTIFMISS